APPPSGSSRERIVGIYAPAGSTTRSRTDSLSGRRAVSRRPTSASGAAEDRSRRSRWHLPGPCVTQHAMDLLAAHTERHPDKPALIEGDRVWSWARLVESRNRLGHALIALGLEPGENVIVYAANSIE